ncbi:hypothetical protein [uncultured Bradyrhizobium sp.]|jgi:hypothetical protein|uniref:hypothetical protein n=1 Tax=uncultured Bradyrhizobium sp. TaxID=199684 RepID=UPI00260383C3|nr:hypothetical protein [uncultured Bradyrhizobium sp.]
MKSLWQFRLFVLVVFIVVGGISVCNLAAEFLRPLPLPLATELGTPPSADQLSRASRSALIAPFRSDLRADYALRLTGQALNATKSARQENASEVPFDLLGSALAMSPHDSRMWLALALLGQRGVVARPVDTLKMSYLTGQNGADLIPLRLASATTTNVLTDVDLKELAQGDVRALLTRLQNQRAVLADAYAKASPVGAAFLEASVKTIDPSFLDIMKKK